MQDAAAIIADLRTWAHNAPQRNRPRRYRILDAVANHRKLPLGWRLRLATQRILKGRYGLGWHAWIRLRDQQAI